MRGHQWAIGLHQLARGAASGARGEPDPPYPGGLVVDAVDHDAAPSGDATHACVALQPAKQANTCERRFPARLLRAVDGRRPGPVGPGAVATDHCRGQRPGNSPADRVALERKPVAPCGTQSQPSTAANRPVRWGRRPGLPGLRHDAWGLLYWLVLGLDVGARCQRRLAHSDDAVHWRHHAG
ncbi:hypothetical protein D9M71_653560 [compost metagenome]